jgi:hypothetical protein
MSSACRLCIRAQPPASRQLPLQSDPTRHASKECPSLAAGNNTGPTKPVAGTNLMVVMTVAGTETGAILKNQA